MYGHCGATLPSVGGTMSLHMSVFTTESFVLFSLAKHHSLYLTMFCFQLLGRLTVASCKMINLPLWESSVINLSCTNPFCLTNGSGSLKCFCFSWKIDMKSLMLRKLYLVDQKRLDKSFLLLLINLMNQC